MKPLHICYISQEYPPETGWGGIGSYTYEMAHGLAALGHRVTIISRAVDKETFAEDNGIEIYRVLPKPNWDSVPLAWRMNRIWPGFAWAAMLKLRAIHRENRIDIVEAAEGRADAFFVSYLPRRPKLVTRLHTARIFIDRLNGNGHRAGAAQDYWLEKQSIRRADIVTAPSKAVVDLTRDWLPLRTRDLFIVPNPLDETKFQPAASERKDLVVYSGRLERRKGVHVIAAAIPKVLRALPTAEFLFLGANTADYDGVKWSDKLLAAVEPNQRQQVRFEQASRDGVIRAYQGAAVCILPSIWENFPYAVLEAMACGTPVIATDCGGFPELIENGISGFLVPVDDADALASRILDVLSKRNGASAMAANARRRIEKSFSVKRVLPNMLAVYDYALAGG
jgi:glycosyltransferase involved in cell wall biosynthesis